MATDINLSQLVINKLTKSQYNEAAASNLINDNELYFITDDDADDVLSEHNVSEDAHTALFDSKQDIITGNVGQFVVIGNDGKVTTKTISIAEEASF